MIRDLIALLFGIFFPPEKTDKAVGTALPPVVDISNFPQKAVLPPSVMEQGQWKSTVSGRTIWQLAFRLPQPVDVRVHLTRLPPEGDIWVYDAENRSNSRGPYPDAHAWNDSQWSDVLHAATIVVEYAPRTASHKVSFRIAEVSHGIIVANEDEPV